MFGKLAATFIIQYRKFSNIGERRSISHQAGNYNTPSWKKLEKAGKSFYHN